jgi:NitT/TauT family transport system substrate-binding protein
MRIKRLLALLAAGIMSVALMAGCSDEDKSSDVTSSATKTTKTTTSSKSKINVAVIKGPSGIGMVNLMENNSTGSTANDYNFSIVSSPEEIVNKISSNQVDLATPPTNLAASLYNKTNGKVQMLAASTKGVLYIMENGETIKSVADLKGKTIYSTGQGANPEYILNYILTQNGIDPKKDVNIEFRNENDELATLLATGTAQVALVPEPFVTTVKTKNADLRVALNMSEEWETASGGKSQLLMGSVIGRKEFIEQNTDAVNEFLNEYKASIEKAISDTDTTSSLCEKYGIIPKAAVAKAALPRCGLTYIDGKDMMEQVKGYFDVLFKANPKSVGGALPDEAFYYNNK